MTITDQQRSSRLGKIRTSYWEVRYAHGLLLPIFARFIPFEMKHISGNVEFTGWSDEFEPLRPNETIPLYHWDLRSGENKVTFSRLGNG